MRVSPGAVRAVRHGRAEQLVAPRTPAVAQLSAGARPRHTCCRTPLAILSVNKHQILWYYSVSEDSEV